jgi:hypothetical protein
MNTLSKTLTLAVLALAASLAQAQSPPPGPAPVTDPPAPPPAKPAKATAQSEAGEPRADTSGPAAPSRQPAASGQPAGSGQPAASAQPAAPGQPPASAQPAAPGQRAASGQRPPSGTGQKAAGVTDRLELGTATVTGDREQPKVMYIVPWKRSDIGDLAGKPMNSLVDEILAPVDRDVFKREVVYYKAVQADASQNGAAGRP